MVFPSGTFCSKRWVIDSGRRSDTLRFSALASSLRPEFKAELGFRWRASRIAWRDSGTPAPP